MLLFLALACGSPSEAQPPSPEPSGTAPAPSPPPAPPAPTQPQPGRIVAVGDLHGDLDNAIAVLRLAGIADAEGHWTGGTATFVQTGDTTDRGPDSGALLDLLRTLGPEAEAAGGRVVPLLGNHEVMNLQGDWRYVDPGDVAAYGGIEARKEAFALDGREGSWLVERDVVARVGDAVFVHGGVHESWANFGVDTLNQSAREAMRGGGGAVLRDTGPLWFRGFVEEPEPRACPALERSLAALGARRMVVGHTTRRDGRIQARCDGRLLVIDIGIADHYGANLGALEIVDGDARALYPSGSVDLPEPP